MRRLNCLFALVVDCYAYGSVNNSCYEGAGLELITQKINMSNGRTF